MIFNFIGNYSVIISLFLSFAIFFRTIFRLKNLNELIKIDLKKEQQKFAEKFGKLNLDKVSLANKQKINKEKLSASIFSKI